MNELYTYDLSKVSKVSSSENSNGVIIGKGGASTVFLAKDIYEGVKYFAIKEISKNDLKLKNIKLDTIYKEIEIQNSISHPNIVKLYTYEENKDSFQLLMDYEERGSFHSFIQTNKGKISEQQAYLFFSQILGAVSFLHKNDIIHRDIKPENILLDKNFTAKLGDFGWADKFGPRFRDTFCGTIEYMAPEIVNEDTYDFQIDVWSLGVLLYEMFHGYSPFKAELYHYDPNARAEEIFKNIKEKDKIVFEVEISELCKDLIQKLLIKNSRYRIKLCEIYEHQWIVDCKANADSKRGTVFSESTATNSKNYSINSIGGESSARIGSVIPQVEHNSQLRFQRKVSLIDSFKSPAFNVLNSSTFTDINLKKFDKCNYSHTDIISGSFDINDTKQEESIIDKVIKKVNISNSKPRRQSSTKITNVSAIITEANASRIKKLSTLETEAPMYEEESSIEHDEVIKGSIVDNFKKTKKLKSLKFNEDSKISKHINQNV